MLSFVTLIIMVHVTGSDVAVRATQNPIVHLTTVVNQLNSKLTALKADLDSKTHQINSLTARVKTGEAEIANLTHTLNRKTNQLNALDSWCKGHVNALTHRVHVLETPIAFSARFRNDSVRVGSGRILIFDNILYQTGGQNYNKTTGFFVAPSTGTYAFFLTIQRNDPNQDNCVEATIVKTAHNNVATATACPPGYSTASTMSTIWLKAGDKVFIRTSHSELVFGYVHTTFSGFKLTAH